MKYQKISITALLLLSLALFGFTSDWVNFESKDGAFKVELPRQPTESEQEIPSEKGNIKMKLFLLDQSKYKDDNELYGINYFDALDSSMNSDMDEVAIDDLLHTSLLGAAKNMNGDLATEKVISLQGYRGREGIIHLAAGGYTICMRVILVHHRMYLLEVAYESSKADNPSANRFFSSFKVAAEDRVMREKPVLTNWSTFKQKDFQILFPELPEEAQQDVETKIGALKMHTFSYSSEKFKDDNVAYALMYSDYPEDMVSSDFKDALVDSFFNRAIGGMVTKPGYKKLSAQKTTYRGYPGRTVKIAMSEQKAVMNMRVYLIKSRAYILETICFEDKDNNAASTKFFNSFVLQTGK